MNIVILTLSVSAPAALHNDPHVKRWLCEASDKISAQLIEDLVHHGRPQVRVAPPPTPVHSEK